MILLSNLAFDCADAGRVASFWRAAVAYEMAEPTAEETAAALKEHPEWAGLAVVDEDRHRHPRLFLQTVPEPKIATNRVRPVLAGADISRLVDLGAQVIDGGRLADVEHNEFRVVAGADGDEVRFVAIEIDAADPPAQARLWSEMLGFTLDGTTCHPPAEWRERVSFFPSFSFVQSDVPKERKNRIHFDLLCRPADGDHQRLLEVGCRDVVRGNGFVTMQDVEGNEFDLNL